MGTECDYAGITLQIDPFAPESLESWRKLANAIGPKLR
jgi:hypothetical protein